MTIYKFQQVGKKVKGEDEQQEVVKEPLTEKDAEASLPKAVHVTYVPRHTRTCVNLCLIFVASLVLAGGVVGGIYLYKHLKSKVAIARCGVIIPYSESDKYEFPSAEHFHFKELPHHPSSTPSMGYLNEVVEVNDNCERMEIPKFDECENAIVLHDFERNLTAIVDRDEGQCFVMNLNRSSIAPPKDLWDLLQKVKAGYYMPQATVIRQTYTVKMPHLYDLTFLGPYIKKECDIFSTYLLKKITPARFRRSAHSKYYGFASNRGHVFKFKIIGM